MTPLRRKVVHAGLIALVGVLTDVGAQLTAAGSVSVPRAVIVGVVIGGFARIMGAVLAALAMPDPQSGDQG